MASVGFLNRIRAAVVIATPLYSPTYALSNLNSVILILELPNTKGSRVTPTQRFIVGSIR